MLLTVATMRSMMSLAQVNVERYAAMLSRLEGLRQQHGPQAMEAAQRGDAAMMRSFAYQVLDTLDNEARAWAAIRDLIRPPKKIG